MRILLGSVSFYPNISGVAVSTYLLAKHLAQEGHTVFVAAPAREMRNYTEQGSQKNLTIFRLKAIPNPFRKGFFVPYLPKKRVLEIVDQVKPDVIHLQDPLGMSLALATYGHRKGIPVIVTNHFMLDYILAYIPRFLHPFARRFLFKKLINFYNRCDVVTCPTKTIATMLQDNGVTKPIYPLSNGVDIHRFFSFVSTNALYARYGLPNKPIVLYLGRVDKDKSIDVLIDAVLPVLSAANAHFVIAGGGDLQKKYARKLKKGVLHNFVTMTGPIPHEEETLVALYQLAALFVIPSTIETQSIVTMEAMAAGKPVVAARAGALPELVKNGRNGLLFRPGDSQELARHIITLLEHPERRFKMAQKSLEMVSNHELKSSLKLFEKLYQQCQSSKSGI